MAKVKIKFPQVIMKEKIIEIPDSQAERIDEYSDNAKGQFIWDHMTDTEHDWTPDNLQSVISAIDVGYGGIIKIEKDNNERPHCMMDA